MLGAPLIALGHFGADGKPLTCHQLAENWGSHPAAGVTINASLINIKFTAVFSDLRSAIFAI